VAFPQYGGIITFIETLQDAWAASVLPHELSHLVVGAATFNCMGASLPTWLDGGLAVYAENNTTQDERSQVYQGLKDGTLPELRALENGFSDKTNLANLEYEQAGIVVDFMLTKYGVDRMTGLLAAVKSGLLIDEALQKTYGFDTAGLDAAWRTSLGLAVTPVPTSLPGGAATPTEIPTLALWTPIVQVTGQATLTPSLPAQAQSDNSTQTPEPTQVIEASTPTPAANSATATPVKPSTPHLPSCGTGAAILTAVVIVIRLRKK
jgi:hypothetical protein